MSNVAPCHCASPPLSSRIYSGTIFGGKGGFGPCLFQPIVPQRVRDDKGGHHDWSQLIMLDVLILRLLPFYNRAKSGEQYDVAVACLCGCLGMVVL